MQRVTYLFSLHDELFFYSDIISFQAAYHSSRKFRRAAMVRGIMKIIPFYEVTVT
jgi:hypothetical protein